jgi:predicted metalloprotease with PDZ domain
VDRTNWYATYISYYPFGGAIALALDLSLRSRSDNRVTLDDYMRAMWRVHGKPGGRRPGFVDHPYTMRDAEARLAEVSGDAAFAGDFFARFIRGREVADYARLFARAGFVLRQVNPGRAWWGDVRLELRGGAVLLAEAPAFASPLYVAGLDVGDEVRQVGATRTGSPDDVRGLLGRQRPGDTVPIVFVDRSGVEKKTSLTLQGDPHFELLPVERVGGVLSSAQKMFRERWLN